MSDDSFISSGKKTIRQALLILSQGQTYNLFSTVFLTGRFDTQFSAQDNRVHLFNMSAIKIISHFSLFSNQHALCILRDLYMSGSVR